ncbi:head-tail connector protein [Romboutsia sedimentorum]|uniref:head-tail connector protein n=1 Tax=Romboutsia sedimentorum TaxID=1368474 RepID=UPI0024DE6787|nr:head-tail connector protein [Romboutsia sedimentorum]MDK2587478.1 head-tail connector protein [Romboutsia sedimentorum]
MNDTVKFSNITISLCKQHLNIEEEFVDDDNLIEVGLMYSRDYILNYTGLTVEELDNIPSINIAVLMIVSDSYNRRSSAFGYDNNNKINFMLKSILDMHKRWL